MSELDSFQSFSHLEAAEEYRMCVAEDLQQSTQSVDPKAAEVYQSRAPEAETNMSTEPEAAASQEPELLQSLPPDNMSHADKPPIPNVTTAKGAATDGEAGEKAAASQTHTASDEKKQAAELPKSHAINASVGRGGKNHKSDVKAVQEKLNARGLDTGGIDGVPGGATVKAIKQFQASFLKAPDGLIEKDKVTDHKLFGESGPVPTATKAPSGPAASFMTQPYGPLMSSSALPPDSVFSLAETHEDEKVQVTMADADKHVEVARKEEGHVEQKEAAPAAKKKDKEPPNSAGLHVTHGPDDLVKTFGTAPNAGNHQTMVPVYYTDGLVTEGKGKHKHVEEKSDDVLQGLDESAMIKGKMQCHEKLAPVFTSIFEEIKAAGDWRYVLQRPGSYCARQNRNAPDQWSIHSWGTAVDINATTNPNGQTFATKNQHKIEHYFTGRGFLWLEHSDAMHFQYHKGSAPQINDDDIAAIKADKPGMSEAKRSLVSDIKKVLDKVKAGKKKMNPERVKHLEDMIAKMG
jgi:peptidoglycan hydrolase-like protein with peptidoglycan-binding domain